MSELILIRHGETAMAGTFCGHSDPELNERGRVQAGAIAESLIGVSLGAIYSSDLQRAQQTAEPLAAAKTIEAQCSSALREIDFGRWEGLRWSEIEARDAAYATRWTAEFPALPAPGGESFTSFERRVTACVEMMLQDAPRLFAIVSHGGVMRVVLERFFGYSQNDAWAATRSYGCVIRLPFEERQTVPVRDGIVPLRARRVASVTAVR